MEHDIWKPVIDYEHIYEVSNTGKVRSKDHFVKHEDGKNRIQKGRVLKTQISSKGYERVSLSVNKKRFQTGVHRLVGLCFVENPDNKDQINHKDGNKLNNHYTNLEWVTNSENQIHAVENGLTNPNNGDKHHNSKLTNDQVKEARNLHKKGSTNIYLAEKFKVTPTAMSNILRFKTYKNE